MCIIKKNVDLPVVITALWNFVGLVRVKNIHSYLCGIVIKRKHSVNEKKEARVIPS